jgi:hypothetical protein
LYVAAAVAILAVAALLWWRRRPRDPEELERRRREHLSRVGRIVEGEILDILETSPQTAEPAARPKRHTRIEGPETQGRSSKRSLICYTYSISGVTYETAQDVTGFEERACLRQIIAGQPASVKFDPTSPGNSMLVSEDWSGLH